MAQRHKMDFRDLIFYYSRPDLARFYSLPPDRKGAGIKHHDDGRRFIFQQERA